MSAATAKPCWHILLLRFEHLIKLDVAFLHEFMAHKAWVLPVPGSPKARTLTPLSTKLPSASSTSCCLSATGTLSCSKVSHVLPTDCFMSAATAKPCWHILLLRFEHLIKLDVAFLHEFMAHKAWVLPVPGSPKARTLTPLSTKLPSASSTSCCLSATGTLSRSKVSHVLPTGSLDARLMRRMR